MSSSGSMPVYHDEDFPVSLAILLAGLLGPALVVAVARDLLTMYITPLQFVLVAAAAFWLLAWVSIEHLDVDRTSFAMVAVAWPWPVLFTALIGFLLLNRNEQIPQGPLAEVFRYLIGDAASFFLYGAVFAIAGVAAVGASRAVESRSGVDTRLPEGRLVAVGIAGAVIAVIVIAGAANLAAASGASVTATEPALGPHGQPALNVTIESAPAELRLTMTAPDGSSVTRRLSHTELSHAPLQVAIPIQPDQAAGHETLPALPGQYRVRLVGLSGVTVAQSTFTAAAGTAVSVSEAQVGTEPPTWSDQPDRVAGSKRHDTAVGLLIENAGSFHTIVSITVGTAEEPRQVAFGRLATAPGERLGVVISVPNGVVESIRAETGGTATVRVYLEDPFDDPITSLRLELPPP